MNIRKEIYGKLRDGNQVHAFTLSNTKGMKAVILEYGGIVAELHVPDRKHVTDDVVLGYEHIEDWENDTNYFGATVGRVANRLGGAQFSLDGKQYQLAPNALPDFGKNHLHGGVRGFNKALWTGQEFTREHEVGVRLEYLSKDGEEAYPGNLNCIIEYTLDEANSLTINYEARTDKTTLVNLTHHSYFNLSGAGSGDILEHLLQIDSDRCTPADMDLIPTGDISSVHGLPVDFNQERTIGSKMDEMQMARFKGYDLNYILKHQRKGSLDRVARVHDRASGRIMEVYTTQPCMHVYTTNLLPELKGKKGHTYGKYGAICLEPQGYPDAPNHKNFMPVVLKPEELYRQTIRFKFSTSA